MEESVSVSGVIDFGTHYRATRNAVRGPILWFAYVFFLIIPAVAFLWIAFAGAEQRPNSGIPTWLGVSLGPAFLFVILPALQRSGTFTVAQVEQYYLHRITIVRFFNSSGKAPLSLKWFYV